MDDDDAPGVMEWVVTYGDMMSLLLTFFIMLVSLSEVVADKKYRSILESLHKYVGYHTSPVSPPGTNFPLNSLIDDLESKLGSFTDKDNGRGGIRSKSIEGPDLRVWRIGEGTSQQVGQLVLFAKNDATLSDVALVQLKRIAADLRGKPNKIEIRAHASPDPLPDDSPYIDKLDLTYHRARNIHACLTVKEKIDHDRVRLTAASDIEPLSKTGDKRTMHFDRAEIFISDMFASEYVGPRETPD